MALDIFSERVNDCNNPVVQFSAIRSADLRVFICGLKRQYINNKSRQINCVFVFLGGGGVGWRYCVPNKYTEKWINVNVINILLTA